MTARETNRGKREALLVEHSYHIEAVYRLTVGRSKHSTQQCLGLQNCQRHTGCDKNVIKISVNCTMKKNCFWHISRLNLHIF